VSDTGTPETEAVPPHATTETATDAPVDAGPDAVEVHDLAAPPRKTRARAAVVLAVVFFLGAVGMAILAASLSSQLRDERGDRRDVERVSSRFAERLVTFDYRRLEQARSSVSSLSTGKFQKEYERAFRQSLQQLITAAKTTSEGTVTDLFVGPVEDDNASAIVVVDTRTTGAAGPRQSFDSYIQLDLVKVRGKWLVDGVTNLNFAAGGAAGGAPAAPSPATTTP
jgi:hypothetical protein